MKITPNSNRYRRLAMICIFIVVASLVVGMIGCGGATPSSIEIRDWYDLDAIRDDLSGSYILMNDLDSTTAGYEQLASPTANGGKGWESIGTKDFHFTGTFNGQGYEIRDLFINRVDEWRVGLFGYVRDGGRIKDIGVVDATVTGENLVGALVGCNREGCTVINCYAKGGVTSTTCAGGLVGGNWGTVSDSYSAGNVTGDAGAGGLTGVNLGIVSDSYSTGGVTGDMNVGGLVGTNGGTVSRSYATGNVTGSNLHVGGLVGLNDFDATVSDSYAKGSVTGNERVGGLMGHSVSVVSNSYATGNVTGDEDVGGLMGGNAGTISDSYSTGSVTGNSSVGGLVGKDYMGTVSDSFWDEDTSGMEMSGGGTGKTTVEMRDITTFSDVGWHIIAVALNETKDAYTWNIVNNVTYPWLGWES